MVSLNCHAFNGYETILTLWMIKKIIIRKQIPAPSRIVNTSVVEWNHMSALGTQTVKPILYWCLPILSDNMTAGKGITIPKFMKTVIHSQVN